MDSIVVTMRRNMHLNRRDYKNAGILQLPPVGLKKRLSATTDGNGDDRDSLTDNQEELADRNPVGGNRCPEPGGGGGGAARR